MKNRRQWYVWLAIYVMAVAVSYLAIHVALWIGRSIAR